MLMLSTWPKDGHRLSVSCTPLHLSLFMQTCLVFRCPSLSKMLAPDQFMTWFSFATWSVMAAWTEMEGLTAYRQPMTVFWSRAQHQHHMTTSLMKLAVGERNIATNVGINFRLSWRILFQEYSFVVEKWWARIWWWWSCWSWLYVVCQKFELHNNRRQLEGSQL